MFDINSFDSQGNSFELRCFDFNGNHIDHLTQWDVNQELYIEHWDYEHTPIFNFYNIKSKNALVVKGSVESDGRAKCSIPNILLTEPYSISVFIYLENNNSGRTVHISQIPVLKKLKPNDYEYKENIEYVSWIKLEAEAREYLAELEAELGTAKDNADKAEECAKSAKTSEENAKESEDNAKISEQNAKESEDNINEYLDGVQKRLSEIPVFETREELFNQVISTSLSTYLVDNFSLNLQNGELYYVTINGVKYECKACTVDDFCILTNDGVVTSEHKDFFRVRTPNTNNYFTVYRKVSGEYSLIIEKPTYHKLDNKYLSIDDELSIDSENPVQNKIVTDNLNKIEYSLSTIPEFESYEEIFNGMVKTYDDFEWAEFGDDVFLEYQESELYTITFNDEIPIRVMAKLMDDTYPLLYRLDIDTAHGLIASPTMIGCPNIGTHHVVINKVIYNKLDEKYLPVVGKDFINAGTLSTISELQEYDFKEDELYNLFTPSDSELSNVLNGGAYSYWIATYFVDTADMPNGTIRYLRLTNKYDGRIFRIDLHNGDVIQLNTESSGGTGGGGGNITVDQTYKPTSSNAQSGKAVAEALQLEKDIINAGTFSTIDKLQEYIFEENKIYNLFIPRDSQLSSSLGLSTETYWVATYVMSMTTLRYLLLTNKYDGRKFRVNLFDGEITQLNTESGGGGNITVDQTYKPTSSNPQSGKAVFEAVNTVFTELGEFADYCYEELDKKADRGTLEIDLDYNPDSPNAQSGNAVAQATGGFVKRNLTAYMPIGATELINNGIDNYSLYSYKLSTELPVMLTLKDIKEVIVGDIDTVLDELHAYAQSLISGGAAE